MSGTKLIFVSGVGTRVGSIFPMTWLLEVDVDVGLASQRFNRH